MRIGFVGLGKLGLPVALAIASRGHEVRAWDREPAVRERIRHRRPLDIDEDQVRAMLGSGRLEIAPVERIVGRSDVVFVAVETPHESTLDGATRLPAYRRDFDYASLLQAVSQIADCARSGGSRLTLAVISTVLPGTMRREVVPLLPRGVELVYNPFFTAMGTTVRDFLEPELVLIGCDSQTAVSRALGAFYQTLHDRPRFHTDLQTAELIKVAYNTFIGQKIVFANAMMELCEKTGADVDDLSAALGLARDRIVSPRYLRGGMGDGGPCHPRDNIALSWLANRVGLSHDIFTDVMRARERQTEWLADLIGERADGLPVVILGKAFKPESHLTDGSPASLLATILEERGVRFDHHDHHVDGGGVGIEDRESSLFFVATRHAAYAEARFPAGSLVLDPWGYIGDQPGVTVERIGRRTQALAGCESSVQAKGARAASR